MADNTRLRNPWPGAFQTIWGDCERLANTYDARYCRDHGSTDWRDWPYVAGDAATQSPDGYHRIFGGVEDVINVAGHRLGTKELESAGPHVPQVAEVPVADEIRGRMPDVCISVKPGQVAKW